MKPAVLFVVLNCSSKGTSKSQSGLFFHTQTFICYCQDNFSLDFLSFLLRGIEREVQREVPLNQQPDITQ